MNRLARTGTGLGCLNDTDVCDPLREARVAAGAEDRVGWELSKPATTTTTDKKTGESKRTAKGSSSKKKELTDEQKRILAKLKKKG